MKIAIREELRLGNNAERSVLRYLSEHVEDRTLIASLLDIDDFEQMLHQRIYATILTLPVSYLGNHTDVVFYLLAERRDIEAVDYFVTLGLAEPVSSSTEALQLTAYLLMLSERRDLERETAAVSTLSSEDNPW